MQIQISSWKLCMICSANHRWVWLESPTETELRPFVNLSSLSFSHSGKQDMTQLLYYKNLIKEDLWLDCADKLTAMIQNIIEFAKLIPGFMRLSQDDQVRTYIMQLVVATPYAFPFFSDSSFKNRLFRTCHYSHVTVNGSISKCCSLRRSNVATRSILHIKF